MPKHLKTLSSTPATAQSGLQTKLTLTTDIIDRLLMAERASAWKAWNPGAEDTGDGGGGGDVGGDFGGGLI